MPLSDTAIKKAKLTQKPYKLSDEKGLHLLINHAGKYWRVAYRFHGKQKTLAFGTYPEVSLSRAREKLAEARRQLADGIDPGELKKINKAIREQLEANSFEAVAREWFAKHLADKAQSHKDKVIRRMERDVFPWIGSKPISEIAVQELLTVIRRIEVRGSNDTAHRALQNCGQIFRYGIATGRCERDPSSDLRGALTPSRVSHFAAITDPKRAGELLRAIEGFKGTFQVQCALKIAPLVFVRPGELRKSKWADIDLDTAEWRFITSKTKTEHIVPLARQAIDMLRDLQPLTGHREHVFPGRDPKQPMSDAAINAALRRMGFDTKTQITGHGFRAMARTIIHEELGFAPEVIEHQLAHRVPDNLGNAYNRTKFLKDRRKMMQAWADYLDHLKVGARIVSLPRNVA
jgi:integrase